MSTGTGPTDYVLQQILDKSRAARDGSFGVLSTGEKIAAALVLNRADWLASFDYTMAQAIERVGADWLANIPEAARVLEHEAELAREAATRKRNTSRRRPEILEITDPESIRALQGIASRMASTASPNCCANSTAKPGGSEIRRATPSTPDTSST